MSFSLLFVVISDHDNVNRIAFVRVIGVKVASIASHLITHKVTQMIINIIFVRVIVATVTQETVSF